MKIAIFGAKNEAVYLYRQLTTFYSDLHKTICFIDNNPQLIGVVIDGLPVVSFIQFIELYSKNTDAIIIAVKSEISVLEIVEQLRQNNIKKIGFVKSNICDYNKRLTIDELGNSNLILWLDETNRPLLLHLEVNIADECNLKCKGCSHFSNLFREESHYDIKIFKRDLTQISLGCYIKQLYLLGGEPLLCDNLNEYVDAAREILPNSDIAITTNGLLVFEQPDKLFDSIRKNDVSFQITPYKPTVKVKDKITEFLVSKDINFRFGKSDGDRLILEFSKTLSKSLDSDCAKSMSACTSSTCRFMRNGRLYKCPVEGMIYKFFDTYNISNDMKCGIDIYKVSDWSKLIEELKNPVDACRYCTEKPQLMAWEVSAHPDMYDWIVT